MASCTETGKKSCPHCGAVFLREDYPTNFAVKKFCTKRCSDASRKTPEAIQERFWAKVDKSAGPEACWPYKGAITTHGYGCAQSGKGRVVGAHKMAYLLNGGTVPDGFHVMHSCDNRVCCNPKHLTADTRQANMSDMAAKGRGRKDHGQKLTIEQAREIKALHGKASSGVIAKQYGITQSYVFGIWAGRTWRTA